MLEAASEDESGGNSRFAGGVMRFAYATVDDLQRVTDITDEEVANSDFGTNTREEFLDDLYRLTSYRTDPDLSEILVNAEPRDAWRGCARKGARFVLNYGRQSGMVNGKRKFFGRMPIEVNGGGAGLVQYLDAAAKKAGIEIFYETRVSLAHLRRRARARACARSTRASRSEFRAKAVVLACGGFEANPEMAHALPRPGLGARQGARHALQRRRRPQDGARHRRGALRQLVGLPRDGLGPLRAGVRRRQRRRPVPEAQLHLRAPDQRRGQALRRRGLRTSTPSPTPSTAARC